MTLTGIKRQSARQLSADRRQLAGWLHEWAIQKVLMADSGATGTERQAALAPERGTATPSADPGAERAQPLQPGPTAFATIGPLAYRGDQPCVPGDIRLIYPADNTHACLPPLYVAVFEATTGNDCVVVPFGRYSIPAVPGEWRTGLKAMPLRILCFWNSCRVPGETLAQRSWRAGRLSAGLLARAATFHAQSSEQYPRGVGAGNATSPRRGNTGTGPPLAHPLDPRWIYLAQETDRIDATLSAVGLTAHSGLPAQATFYPTSGDATLKAAEDKPDFTGVP